MTKMKGVYGNIKKSNLCSLTYTVLLVQFAFGSTYVIVEPRIPITYGLSFASFPLHYPDHPKKMVVVDFSGL